MQGDDGAAFMSSLDGPDLDLPPKMAQSLGSQPSDTLPTGIRRLDQETHFLLERVRIRSGRQ